MPFYAPLFSLFVPALFGFSEIDAARNSFFSGVALTAYSLLTKHHSGA